MSKTRRWMDKILGTRSAETASFKSRLGKGERAERSAAMLARAAGAGHSGMLEQLEQRQLLFTLQVSTADPTFVADPNNPGFGTVTSTFGYFIPFLSANIPGETQRTGIVENFDQRAPSGGVNVPANLDNAVAPGQQATFFGLFASSGAANTVRITPVAAPGTGNTLNISIAAGGWVELVFRVGPGNNATPRTFIGWEWTNPTNAALPGALRVDARAVAVGAAVSTAIPGGNGLADNPRPVDAAAPAGPTIHSFDFAQGFQAIRLNNTGGVALNLAIQDNVTGIIPPARFAPYLNARLFGAQISLYGRADEATPAPNDGTALQVLDLYGRDMTATIDMGIPEGDTRLLADGNGDGIPDFNDGIGRINLIRGDARAGFSIVGGTIASTPFGFQFTIASESLTDAFRTGGFALEGSFVGGAWQFRGFEDTAATVIIGSPWIRDNRNTDVYLSGPTGVDNTFGIPVTTPGLTQEVRVFGAVNRPNGNPAGAWARYPYANATGHFGLTGTILENTLVPAVNPVQPAPVANPIIEQGVGFDAATLLANRTWGQFQVDGLLFGAVRFNGSLSRISVSNPAANIIIDGDLGRLVVNGNLGGTRNPQSTAPSDGFRTFPSQITVGRSLGQVLVSGRIIGTPITVLGATNDPNRATTEFLRYGEAEVIQFFQPGVTTEAAAAAILAASRNLAGAGPFIFGGSVGDGAIYRNDSLPGAEFVGTGLRGAIITGTIGLGNSQFHAEDTSDVYAFAANNGSTISVNVAWAPGQPAQNTENLYARIVDINGRVLATHPFAFLSPNFALPNNQFSVQFSFVAPSSEVYYLVLGAAGDGQLNTSVGYTATISGQAAVTVGQISIGGGTSGAGMPIFVQNGAVGMIRVGNGYIDVDGTVVNFTDPIASVESVPDYLALTAGNFSIAGSVYSIIAGSDIRGSSINVGGNLGSLYTGRFFSTDNEGAGGLGVAFGNVHSGSLTVGGSIGILDISGSVAYQNTTTGEVTNARPGGWTLRTGAANSGPGHIGQFLVGEFINGSAGAGQGGFTFVTNGGSIIDRWVVGTRGAGADTGRIVLGSPQLNFGAGTDVRFFDFRGVANGVGGQLLDTAFQLNLGYNQTQTIEDESGATYSITITGGLPAQGAITSTGTVFFLPAGSASIIGRVTATLNGAANFIVTNNSGQLGRVALDSIALTVNNPANSAARSNVLFQGNGEIDVRSLQATGGALTAIRNSTPNGDLVSVDVAALGSMTIDSGSLGYTENLSGVGSSNFGTFLGVVSGLQAAVGAPLGVNPQTVTASPGSGGGGGGGGGVNEAFVPVRIIDNAARLEDVGTPFDGYLEGLVVRTGNLATVSAARIGDVILQSSGLINSITANPSAIRGGGVFRGITGSIYAGSILAVDVGDGLAGPGSTGFASAGIFAENDIGRVVAGLRYSGASLNGVIAARNLGANPTGGPALNGINAIEVYNGTVNGAYISVSNLDFWWRSARNASVNGTTPGDVPVAAGTIHRISLSNTSLVRSSIFSTAVNNISITGGNWDASTLETQATGGATDAQTGLTSGSVNMISADAFVNTTLDGEVGEYRTSGITVAGDLQMLMATGVNGDISDTNITVGRNVTAQIMARNMLRANVSISGRTNYIFMRGDVRASEFNTGAITVFNVSGNIRSSNFNAAGAITQMIAGGEMSNVSINSTGAAGGITYLTARSFSGSLSSSGNLGTIFMTGGDFTGSITTTALNPAGANITFLYATRDLNLSLNIAGDVGTIYAGRNVGRREVDGVTGLANTPDVINISGNLTTITAGGQLYADVRVGQSILGLVYTGFSAPVLATPGNAASDQVSDATITAYGRIAGVYWFGDFGGRITSFSGGVGLIYIVNGSVRSNAVIDVRDGDLSTLYIISGHLLGNVSARDGSIGTIYVVGDPTVFGNIGVDPNLSLNSTVGTIASQFRTQLPPGSPNPAAVNGDGIRNGATITAGLDITTIYASGGMYESAIVAGRGIQSVYVGRGSDSNSVANTATGTTTPSFIVAGDTVGSVFVTRLANGLFVGAGITALGNDNAVGGVGAAADTVRQGAITSANFIAGTNNVVLVAGMNAGADGIYSQGNDDLAAAGISSIGTVSVTGAVSLRAWADSSIGFTTAGVVRGGGAHTGSVYIPGATFDPRTLTAVPGGHVALAANVATAFTTALAETGSITFSGPGQAFFDDATDSIVLVGTTAASTLRISTTGGSTTLSGVRVRSLNDASLASLTIVGSLQGNSGVYVDGTIGSITATNIDITSNATFGTGVIGAGSSISSFSTGNFLRGILQTGGSDGTNAGLRSDGDISTVSVTGAFGTGAGLNNRRIQARNMTSLTIGGTFGGVVSVDRDLTTATVTTGFNAGSLRTGGKLTSLSSGAMTNARVSAGGGIGSVSVTGDVTDSQILGGGDLGTDGVFGGVGTAADRVRSNGIGSVNVFGNFPRSDIAAGVLRGGDGFFGTADDLSADGRANVGPVTITGATVGSASGSQSYRVAATGKVQSMTINGINSTGAGNFRLQNLPNQPTPIQVSDFRITQAGGIYQATIRFNQNIAGAASLVNALTIQELRGVPGAQNLLAPLTGGVAGTPGVDYTVAYDALTFTATITFSQAVTSRNLTNNAPGADTLPALSGPGVYRFTIAATGANALRGSTTDAALDGNSNGVSGDAYQRADILGDAGDRLGTFTGQTGTGVNVSLYSPVNLNNIINSQGNANLFANPNQSVLIRGYMGDHPDFDANSFNSGSDIDIYQITLTAGQILRIGAPTGNARNANIVLRDATGNAAPVVQLNAAIPAAGQDTTERVFYITTTGVYNIVVSSQATQVLNQTLFAASAIAPPALAIFQRDLFNFAAVPGATGDYAFTVRIVDDGNSGFRDTQNLAAFAPVAPAPLPGAFNAQRDNTVIVAGLLADTQYVFRYVIGADGVLDNADDRIVGQLFQISTGANLGIVSTRSAGPDGVLGNGDDVLALTNDAGNGQDVVVAPLPNAFLGTAPGFNQPGNLPFINVGQYTFRLDPGANGRFDGNTNSDDVVIGTDRFGNAIERRAGANGTFSNAVGTDDITTYRGSIGDPGSIGNPNNVQTDIDVVNLNNGLPIQPGTRYRITLRTNEDGGNFGRLLPTTTSFAGLLGTTVRDLRGQIQFGLFENTNANSITNANLLGAANRVQLFGGATPNTNLASDSLTRYGYDARGDYFFEFTALPTQGNANPNAANPADWASLALYIQGAVRSNYSIEIQQIASATLPAVNTQAVTQNILIEVQGGTINWLEAGGRNTVLDAFDPVSNGFTGLYGAQSANALNYITTNNAAVNANSLVLQLQAAFNAIVGFNPGGQPLVRISANAADFAGQSFSTVFLTSSQQPGAFFNNGQFGAVQRSDMFNANRNDQSVIFMPSLNALGQGSSQAGLDAFIRQLTTLAGRQIGQLLGLRTSTPIGGADVAPFEITASGTPADVGAGNTYRFNAGNRGLSPNDATSSFILGQQNSNALLQRIFFAQ